MPRRSSTRALVLAAGFCAGSFTGYPGELRIAAAPQVKPLPAPTIPDPPPVSSPQRGSAPAASDAQRQKPENTESWEELKGVKVVNFSSQHYSGAPAQEIVTGDPAKVWASTSGSFPQEFVLELAAPAMVAFVVFNNQALGDPKRSAKDVEILVSNQGASFGFELAMSVALKQGEIGQGIELKSPKRARWIKIRVMSNHGAEDRTTLGMLQVIGRPL